MYDKGVEDYFYFSQASRDGKDLGEMSGERCAGKQSAMLGKLRYFAAGKYSWGKKGAPPSFIPVADAEEEELPKPAEEPAPED